MKNLMKTSVLMAAIGLVFAGSSAIASCSSPTQCTDTNCVSMQNNLSDTVVFNIVDAKSPGNVICPHVQVLSGETGHIAFEDSDVPNGYKVMVAGAATETLGPYATGAPSVTQEID